MAADIETPVGSAPVIPVILIGIGAYLAWFGVRYFGSDTRYPTDPVKAVLTGKPLPVPGGQTTAQDIAQQVGAASPQQQPPNSSIPNSGQLSAKAYDIPALEALWTSQGGSGQTAFEAANVAMAESSGNPRATSANPDGGTNVGLWQLDTKGVGAGHTIAELMDPATNARITVMNTANGTNWRFWADAVVVGGVYVGPKA